MSDVVVLDASAMLALINEEPGHEAVEAVMPGALLSSVNLAEVVSKLAERGMPAERAQAVTLALGPRIVDFDATLAEISGRLRPLTRASGLSLGDRCCLALAKHRGAVAFTTERVWVEIADAVGVSVRNIRPGAP